MVATRGLGHNPEGKTVTDVTLTDQIIQATPGRTCQSIGCALCCKLPSIDFDEGVKPAGTWCKHNEHPKCGIYSDRPDICRKFFCTWLGDPHWPEHLNPIKTGCMLLKCVCPIW